MRRGFTLIELIVVIALIALVGGLIVINAQGFLRGLGEEPVDRILQKAVREARFQAAALKEPVFLSYDEENSRLMVLNSSGRELAGFPITRGSQKEEVEINFEQNLAVQGLEDFDLQESVPVEQVVFRPDRSSTPFNVTIRTAALSYTQQYDPFSSIVIHDSRQR